MALFTENGPLNMTATQGLQPNPFAWNSRAHVLYIDAPYGVGFSVSTSNAHNTRTAPSAWNSDMYAALMHSALKLWFRAFTMFAERPIYLFGESYAGHFLSALTSTLLDDPNMKIGALALGV